MGRLVKAFFLFLLSFAMACGDIGTLDNEEVSTSTSKLITSRGFTNPIASISSLTDGNFAACGATHYFAGLCHNGTDIITAAETPVYAMVAGTVIAKSASQSSGCPSGWGYDYGLSNTCNMALAVQHYDLSGQPFVAIYGHMRYVSSYGVGTTFLAGQKIGVIGRYRYTDGSAINADHLHFGIKPGTSTPSAWGRYSCSANQAPSSALPPECNPEGFVAPGTYMAGHFPTLSFSYDGGSAYTCSGPVTGGAETNWVYSCEHPRTAFTQGETVYSIIRINNIPAYTQFRYKVDAIKNGSQNWSWTADWNYTGQWAWDKSFFWPTMSNAQQGNWTFRFSVDTGSGFRFVDARNFTVSTSGPQFSYNSWIVTCRGPVTGGSGTNWVYTCQNPTPTFNIGDAASALIHIDSLGVNFRWKTEIYANGTLQWTETPGWNDVGYWGWEKAYYWPTTGYVWLSGNWEYRFFVDTGSGYQYLDSAYFRVY